MTRDEVIDLLTVITAVDRRTVGEADVQAWLATIGDLDFADARDAALAHYRETTEWLMPAHVRRRVAATRAKRLERAHAGPPSTDPAVIDDPARYLEALRTQTHANASGDTGPRAIGAGQ